MRVTKKVENYIRAQVKAKVFPKYEAEKEKAQLGLDLKADIERRAEEAAIAAAQAIYDEVEKYPDILEYDKSRLSGSYLSFGGRIYFKDYGCSSSVYRWETRMKEEIDRITDEIIVTLELGGDKADLDRMLSEIK